MISEIKYQSIVRVMLEKDYEIKTYKDGYPYELSHKGECSISNTEPYSCKDFVYVSRYIEPHKNLSLSEIKTIFAERILEKWPQYFTNVS